MPVVAQDVRRIAWFDDETDDEFGRFLVDSLASVGLHVDVLSVDDAPSGEKALAACMETDLDIAIIDLRLGRDGGGVDGVSLAQKLGASWYGPIVVLTRNPKNADELRGYLDPRLPFLQYLKPESYDPAELETWFIEFLPVIMKLANRLERSQIRNLANVEPARAFLEIDARSTELDLDTRLEQKATAAQVLAEDRPDLFADDQVRYAVVVGWPPTIVRIGYNEDSPPSKDFLKAEQRRVGGSALVLRRGAHVNVLGNAEEGSTTTCVPSDGPLSVPAIRDDWFPSLSVEVNSSLLDIHFDTGSDFTFLSYEGMRGLSECPVREDEDDWQPLRLTVGIGPAKHINVSEWIVKLTMPAREGQVSQRLPTQLVRRFVSSGLDAECKQGRCPTAINSTATYLSCRYRLGLIGRDVFRHTGWTVITDFHRRRAFVVEPNDPWLNDGGGGGDKDSDGSGAGSTPSPPKKRFRSRQR